MAVVDSMSLVRFFRGGLVGRRWTLRRAALGTVLLLLAAAPDGQWEPSGGREHAELPKPVRTVGRRQARRPLPKRIITDQDILDQAQAAYIRGERQHAIDLATSIADKGGELATPAWRFIGLAACSVRANRLASRAYTNLATTDDQQALVQACQSNGLILQDKQFVAR